jgi:hypothetical protein
MNTYTIMVERFIVDNTILDRPNYVTKIIARVHGLSPSGQGALLVGAFDVGAEDPTLGEFIPVDQLTPEMAETWIMASGQWTQINAELDQLIAGHPLIVETTEITPPWLQTALQSMVQESGVSTASPINTSASNTTTNLTMGMSVNEETLRAMVYQVLEEINSGTV